MCNTYLDMSTSLHAMT